MAMKTKTVAATAECGTEIKITVPAGPLPSKERHDVLKRAFDAVANPADWKAPIDARVTRDVLARANVTIEDILEAVEFFTATTATVSTPDMHGARSVRADGYRRGPAGG